MGTNRITYRSILTLVAAYLGLFVGLIDANAINLALPADSRRPRRRYLRRSVDDRRVQHHFRRGVADLRIAR
jgi:hypothetical protein